MAGSARRDQEDLAARGIYTFTEHARAVRALGHIVRYAGDLRHAIRKLPQPPPAFPWSDFVTPAMAAGSVISEDVVARILEAARLPVARGRIATTAERTPSASHTTSGLPVAIKAISPAITHRAAAGLVALDVDTPEAVAKTDAAFRARAAALEAPLDGLWIQHMFRGDRELIVTALRDAEFGVIVGVGIGGGVDRSDRRRRPRARADRRRGCRGHAEPPQSR